VTVGRLYERERTAIREARAKYFKIVPELEKSQEHAE
jgi:hypothetical protein